MQFANKDGALCTKDYLFQFASGAIIDLRVVHSYTPPLNEGGPFMFRVRGESVDYKGLYPDAAKFKTAWLSCV